MRTIVVDDEPWMLKRFALECECLPDIQLLGSFRSPLEALRFAGQNSVELAFLDVEMPELNGLELAQKLRELIPDVIIIFLSAYDNYMTEALRTKTGDYFITKPYNTEDVESALDRVRLSSGKHHKVAVARTFGTFELFSHHKRVLFEDAAAKELLALLVDRRGDILLPREAGEILWPDLSHAEREVQMRITHQHLQKTLADLHLEHILGEGPSGLFIRTSDVDCDMYQFYHGDPKIAQQYTGAYMTGYDWAHQSRLKLRMLSRERRVSCETKVQNDLLASISTLYNPERTIRAMNESFLTLVGYTREEIKDRFHNSFRAMIFREDFKAAVTESARLFAEGCPAKVQYRLIGNNGAEIWVICTSEPPKQAPDGLFEISSVLIDISETKAEQRALEQAACHDSLTGLLNRSCAQTRVGQYLASTDFTPSGAFVLMDIDHFKAVNDTYGRAFADTVLTDIAAILNRSFRSTDLLCRLGGDEMMIFLKGIGQEEDAREKIKGATEALRKRLIAKTKDGELSCSFGAAMCPQDGCDFETLYAHADRALSAAKKKRNCTVWFKDLRHPSEPEK